MREEKSGMSISTIKEIGMVMLVEPFKIWLPDWRADLESDLIQKIKTENNNNSNSTSGEEPAVPYFEVG